MKEPQINPNLRHVDENGMLHRYDVVGKKWIPMRIVQKPKPQKLAPAFDLSSHKKKGK